MNIRSSSSNYSNQVIVLVLCWWLLGTTVTVAALLGLINPWLSVLLVLPLGCFVSMAFSQRKKLLQVNRLEMGLLIFLALVWLSHLVQCFTPETGFDAVWYHLPVIKLMVANHGVVYLPDLYQSVNPLFSDLLFLLGYQAVGDIGAKLVGYLLAATVVMVSFALARLYVTRTWALLFSIAISLIQVVSWQAASAYIDVAKALWELSAIYVLLVMYVQNKQKQLSSKRTLSPLLLSAVFFGASLATKHFSIVLIPTMFFIVWLLFHRWKYVGLYAIVSILALIPFDVRSYIATGDPLFSMTYHLRTFSSFGSYTTPLQQIVQRSARLPVSLITIAVVRDYISPLIVLIIPLIIWLAVQWKKLETTVKVLVVFAATQWLVWWIVPPASTRYALSGFIFILLLITQMLANFSEASAKRRNWLLAIYVLMLIFSFVPRLYVNYRSWQYLTGKQTKTEYIQQFYDGSIDSKLQSWHELK